MVMNTGKQISLVGYGVFKEDGPPGSSVSHLGEPFTLISTVVESVCTPINREYSFPPPLLDVIVI